MDTGSDNRRRLNTPSDEGDVTDSTQDDERGDLDFGSFVSRSIRSTSDRFRESDGEAGSSYTIRSRGGAGGDSVDGSDLPLRPSRKWRDSVEPIADPAAPSTESSTPRSRRFIDDPDDDVDVHDEDGHERRTPPAWWSTVTRNEAGEQDRNRLILLALALLLIIALVVFGLIRLLGGDDGDETVVDPTPVATEDNGDLRLPIRGSTPEADEPTEPARQMTPTPTPGIRDGGDNTLPGNHRTVPAADVWLDGVRYVLTV